MYYPDISYVVNYLVDHLSDEKLREMLTVFLRKLPITQKEITKKKVFDELKVKNRNDKLCVLKEVIQDVRPNMVLKSKKTQPERVAKKGMKGKVYPK